MRDYWIESEGVKRLQMEWEETEFDSGLGRPLPMDEAPLRYIGGTT